MGTRKLYLSVVPDQEWALVAPCRPLLPEDARQREHALHAMFNGLHYAEDGRILAWMPNNLPPWA